MNARWAVEDSSPATRGTCQQKRQEKLTNEQCRLSSSTHDNIDTLILTNLKAQCFRHGCDLGLILGSLFLLEVKHKPVWNWTSL